MSEIPEKCFEIANELPINSVKKAVSAAASKKVYKINDNPPIHLFLGEERDHILLPYTFCNCMDFLLNSIIRRKKEYCYHLLSYCIQNEKEGIKKIDLNNKYSLIRIIKEVVEKGKSPLIRKVLSESKHNIHMPPLQ